MGSRFFGSLAVAMFLSTLVFAYAAGAQETTDASAAATDTRSDPSRQPLVFAEGEQRARADARAEVEQPGPLAGTEVGTLSTDSDPFIEVVSIPRPDCNAREGASFVLQDEDGTQADFIDGENVQIDEARQGLKVVSVGVRDADIVPLNVRGGDDVLDSGGLVIVTSTDIRCEDDDPPPDDPPDDPPPDDPPPNNPRPDDPSPPEPEPQDAEKGPLAGGTAVGNDVLVPGDVIDVLPDGTRVVGIDQIVIETENCELTAQGDGLTITMSERGVPFRIRDGDNVDITIKPDGTIVANGRRTLGDSFPPGARDNPDRLIVPIPVDPENDQFPEGPNDTFPIISSTGIGGEGCRVLDAADASDDDTSSMDDNANPRDNVVPDTVSDEPLPDTGGVPLSGLLVAGLFLVASGLLVSKSALRPVSTSARRRSAK